MMEKITENTVWRMKNLRDVATTVISRLIQTMKMIEKPNTDWIQSTSKNFWFQNLLIYIVLHTILRHISPRYANVMTPERHVRTRLYFTSVSFAKLVLTFHFSSRGLKCVRFAYLVFFFFCMTGISYPFPDECSSVLQPR